MPVELTKVVDNSQDDIGLTASVATNLKKQIHEAAVQATKDVFTGQILPAAKAYCPEGGRDARGRPDPHPGRNRESLQVSFRDRLETSWISAWLFSESGYGFLVEHGTSHNRALTRTNRSRRRSAPAADRTPARPYIYPAIMQFVGNIADRARQILEGE